jgi:energy-coupling factor transporter ATP-binding protein EcfA2
VPIDVVFARAAHLVQPGQLSNPAIVIIPDTNNWNDYGRRLFAHMRLVVGGQLDGENEAIRFMFDGCDHTDTEINAVLASVGAPVVSIDRSARTFCSLLSTPEAYQKLVARLGFDNAVSALRRMGDAVVVRMEGHDEARLTLIDSEAFYVSMLRANDAFAALRRGGRYLRREIPEPVDDAASSFAIGVQLAHVRSPFALRFNFDRDQFGRDRVAVLIGRNGVGKSQLLRHLILRLADGYEQDGMPTGETRLLPRPKAQRVVMFSSVASDPYPEAIPPWFGIDYEYFAMTAAREQHADAFLQALVSCWRDYAPLIIRGQPTNRSALLEETLHRMGIWRQLHLPLRPARNAADDPLGRMARVFEGQRYLAITTNMPEVLRLRLIGEIDWAQAPLLFSAGGPRHLSSGELAMFRFAAQAVAAIEQGSLLLFDEPETHLHPNFISEFMEILQDLLDATRSAAIIATHSAYVVREVPRERVSVLSIDGKEVQAAAPRLQTFGASIDTISQFVFNDTSVSHRFQETLATWINGPGRELTIEQIVERFGAQLNPESLSYMAGLKRLQRPVVDL